MAGIMRVLSRYVVACIALLLFAAPLHAQQIDQHTEVFQGRHVKTREVLVKFHVPTSASIQQVGQNEDIDGVEGVGGGGLLLFRSRSKDVATLVRNLSARPDVAFVEPNFIVYAVGAPNDPLFGQLWGLQNTGQSILGVTGTPGADIGAVSAWNISTGSTANVVAVVDTGIDYTHPDLAANVWSAPTAFTVTIAGKTISCAAGTHGFNAITNTCDPMDDNNHGTHVSGTIGAAGNSGVGVVGVNWTASVMGTKFLDRTGSGTLANAINAIEFAIQAKATFGGGANVRVMSASWGCYCFSQSLLDQINRANTNDMLFVAAAGNDSLNIDSTPFYPATFNAPNVVAVGATDNNDALASFSNYGASNVDLGAPGVSVLSTIVGGNYAYFSGTSMATPHVSGAAALVLSKCSLSTAALRNTILSNVDPIPSLAGRTVTGGRLDVNKALLACTTPVNPDFSLSATPVSRTVTAGNGTTYTVTVTASGGFTDVVALSASGVPAGVSVGFSPFSVSSGSSTMTVSTSSSASPGTYLLTILGASGSLSHTATVTLVVQAPPVPDFSLSVSPTSRTVTAGNSTTYTATIAASGGFTGTVALSVSGLPTGVTASFNHTSVTTAGSSTLTVKTNSTTVARSYQLTITGTSGSLSHSRTATLTVRARFNN
jgi:serine protease